MRFDRVLSSFYLSRRWADGAEYIDVASPIEPTSDLLSCSFGAADILKNAAPGKAGESNLLSLSRCRTGAPLRGTDIEDDAEEKENLDPRRLSALGLLCRLSRLFSAGSSTLMMLDALLFVTWSGA